MEIRPWLWVILIQSHLTGLGVLISQEDGNIYPLAFHSKCLKLALKH